MANAVNHTMNMINNAPLTVANNPDKFNYFPVEVISRFFEKVNKTETCWLWTASFLGNGYGGFWLNGKMEKSNRVSWMIHNGKIPAGICVLHKCDVRLCVNPAHLFLGTQKENNDDKMKKGRGTKGETHGMARFTEETIKRIRLLYGTEIKSQRKLAKMFKASQAHIQKIVTKKSWSHI